MGIVSDYLCDLIARQVNEKGIVVWFDPEGHYRAFVQTLAIPNITIARFEGSFFALRYQIDQHLNDESSPRLVAYIPLAEEDTHNALIELICAGELLKPGQPGNRNTRLSVIASAALRDMLSSDRLRAIDKQVTAGKLSLAELDRIAALGGNPGVISLIFGKGEAEQVALALLGSTNHDAEIVARHAQAEVTELLGTAFGVTLPAEETPDDWRVLLARYVLSTDLLASLRDVPVQLASINTAIDERACAACIDLARTWRRLGDLSESYIWHSNHVEQELGLRGMRFQVTQARDCETFAAIEEGLQVAIESALLTQVSNSLLELARRRQSSFWSRALPETQARWRLIEVAGHLLLIADQIETALKQSSLSAAELFSAYTEGEHPWCELDTNQRLLEEHCRGFDFDAKHVTLEQLIARARQRYMQQGGRLAEAFVRALKENNFHIPHVRRQRDIYASVVAPPLREGKTAYLVVDALRFELARELVRALDGYKVTLSAALGTPPTVTPIGMVALLPGAEAEAQVISLGAGKLGVELEQTVLKDRKGRVEWLKAHTTLAEHGEQASVFETKLDELLALKKNAKTGVEKADLLFVTSQEIDELAESDNHSLARDFMEKILGNLRRAIRKLADLGCKTIILTADHGFLFGEELGDDMKLDPPGGQTLDLHRRVWVGRGGSADTPFLRVPLAAWGLSNTSALEIAIPWGFAAFKVQGGARAYFHGGLSPQELIIPVAVITPTASTSTLTEGEISWTVTLGSKKISTRFCSVQVSGKGTSLFASVTTPPPVRVEVRVGGTPISTPVAASYGLNEATHDVQLQFAEDENHELVPVTVTLMLAPERSQPATYVSLHVLDAVTGRELARLENVEMSIAIS
ncbi:MAG TPA: PglZ domain-containing protein [Ktedonobacteraceae bacterium]